MEFTGYYTISIKMENLHIWPEHDDKDLEDMIKSRAKEALKSYFNGTLLDPTKKITYENTKAEIK